MKEDIFGLTAEHLALIRRLNIKWWDCEFGAPCVDPKRPYGNSQVEYDIAEILGWELFEDADGEKHLSREQREKANRLHRELETALQVFVLSGVIPEGTYRKTRPYDRGSWKQVCP